MTKLNLKKKMACVATKMGTKQARNELNQACVCFIYQPKTAKSFEEKVIEE